MVIAIPNYGVVDNFSSKPNSGRSKSRWSLTNVAILGTITAGSSALLLHSHKKNAPSRSKQQSLLQCNKLAITALSGAVGEVFSCIALYPLDTLKVHCQARGSTTHVSVILRELISSRKGNILHSISTLYAGVGTAALGAACMGSIYLASFYFAKNALIPPTQSTSRQQPSSSVNASNTPPSQETLSLTTNTSASLTTSTTTTTPSTSINSSAWAASLAGIFASVLCSAIESPIEALKIKSQLGLPLSGPSSASLYTFFIPFLLKSIPHDVAELCTFSQLSDARQQKAFSHIDSRLTQGVGDMVMGGIAGAAAAIVSMPFDTVFTRMNSTVNVHGMTPGSTGVLSSIGAFLKTGRSIMCEHGGGGVRSLFAGLTPRLLYTVPAGILYWAAVEATRRTLEERMNITPHNDDDDTGTLPLKTVFAVSTINDNNTNNVSTVLSHHRLEHNNDDSHHHHSNDTVFILPSCVASTSAAASAATWPSSYL